MNFNYDVIVIGAGHAGCEAAAAAANLGSKTCLITMDMNKIAQMSCNPAVGGIAKGQIVREVDALGGQMGIITDATAIQFRMLNRSKGPAVWSPRAQCDRGRFIWRWRQALDSTPGLDIWQDQATELIVEGRRARGVRTIWGAELLAGSVVITAGTFLNGLMHIGRRQVEGGRIAEPAAHHLGDGHGHGLADLGSKISQGDHRQGRRQDVPDRADAPRAEGLLGQARGAAAADVVGGQGERDHEQAHSAACNEIVSAALDVDLADDIADDHHADHVRKDNDQCTSLNFHIVPHIVPP